MSREVGKQTALDKAISELLTTSNKLKVTDGKQIRDILIKLKEYEYYMVSNAFYHGYEKLWWSQDMQQNYYYNEYGKIEDTKEINQAERDRRRQRESQRERETEGIDTGIIVEPVRVVQAVREVEPVHSDRLGWSKSSASKPYEGTTFNNARLRSLLQEEGSD